MTTVVAVSNEKGAYIGCDSLASSGAHGTVRADKKIFRVSSSVPNIPDMLFGFTKSYRMGQIAQFHLEPKRKPASVSNYKYLVTQVVPSLREAMAENGSMEKYKETDSGGIFLVLIEGTIYIIEQDFQVGIVQHGYSAIGSGTDVALGSLHRAHQGGKTPDPKEECLAALRAAQEFNNYTREPFHLLEQKVK